MSTAKITQHDAYHNVDADSVNMQDTSALEKCYTLLFVAILDARLW